MVSGWKERVADPTVAQFLCGGMHLFSIKTMRRGSHSLTIYLCYIYHVLCMRYMQQAIS